MRHYTVNVIIIFLILSCSKQKLLDSYPLKYKSLNLNKEILLRKSDNPESNELLMKIQVLDINTVIFTDTGVYDPTSEEYVFFSLDYFKKESCIVNLKFLNNKDFIKIYSRKCWSNLSGLYEKEGEKYYD